MLMFKKSSLENGAFSSTKAENGAFSSTKAYIYFLSTTTNYHTITQENQNICTTDLLVTKPRVY